MKQVRRIPLLVLILVALFASHAQSGKIAIEPIITNIDRPLAISHAGDGSGRLFISLQQGRIIIYDGNQVLATPFLQIESIVSCCGERGLLGLAFDPDYETNGFFYVNYTRNDGDTVIARYTVSGDPNVADPGSAVTLLTIDQPLTNHNGGQLHFGSDGYLYIGLGDGGGGGDPEENGQDLTTLLGAMLRVDVSSGSALAPPDNPFVGNQNANDLIWAYGLRNPWRFSFDRATGDLYIADVGQSSWEEVNFQAANSPGGQNYGWPIMEGMHCYPSGPCDQTGLTLPVLEYSHAFGCSITGGYVYRGTRIPQIQGTYLFSDYCSGTIAGAKRNINGTWSLSTLMSTGFSVSTFGEDESGELYFADYAGGTGAIYRIVAPFAVSPPSGTYVATQKFDVTLIMRTPGLSIVSGAATLNGANITISLASCLVGGTFAGGGQSFRCTDFAQNFLNPGVNTLTVSLNLNNGSNVKDTVIWEILDNTEP